MKTLLPFAVASCLVFLTEIDCLNINTPPPDRFQRFSSPLSPKSQSDEVVLTVKEKQLLGHQSTQQELHNVLRLLPKSVRDSARSYIASRLRRIVMIPNPDLTSGLSDASFEDINRSVRTPDHSLTLDLTTLSNPEEDEKRMKLSYYRKLQRRGKSMIGLDLVPIVPKGAQTRWIPGQLLSNHITKREIKLIHESAFGPLKSVTMFPSIMSSVLVFNKRYDPEALGRILKFNFGIETEPNGVIKGDRSS